MVTESARRCGSRSVVRIMLSFSGDAGTTAALGPLGLYLSYDVGALGRWPAWALSLLALEGGGCFGLSVPA